MPRFDSEQHANGPQTTLSAAVSSTSATTVSVTSAAGFPSGVPYRILIDDELLLVTAGAGGLSWTVVRGVEGTTAATHAFAATVLQVVTAATLETARSYWLPADNGFLAATYDPVVISTGSTLLFGMDYYQRVRVSHPGTITNAYFGQLSRATEITPMSNCYVGVYNQVGTRLGVSADISSVFASNGFKTIALTLDAGQSLAVVPGQILYVGLVLGGGDPSPSLMRPAYAGGVTPNPVNMNLSGADLRLGRITATGVTALPTAIDPVDLVEPTTPRPLFLAVG